MNPRLFTFVGGKMGQWSVDSVKAIIGDPLPAVERLDIVTGAVVALPEGGRPTDREAGRARSSRSHADGSNPDPQEREVVDTDSRRTASPL
jgi:hypothetical protein